MYAIVKAAAQCFSQLCYQQMPQAAQAQPTEVLLYGACLAWL